jgi:hypothetical protein
MLLPAAAAWYAKECATFGDALAIVRRALWAEAACKRRGNGAASSKCRARYSTA